MSKRELKKYIGTLTKKQLEEQVIDLYSRFKPVKEYYNFVFNPKEENLIIECKFKINKEYFPTNGRKPKKRRSVAQKFIKKFILLGVSQLLIADIMLYNIEIAQEFETDYKVNDSFYTSMLKSFEEAIEFINDNGIKLEFKQRINNIIKLTEANNWINNIAFERYLRT